MDVTGASLQPILILLAAAVLAVVRVLAHIQSLNAAAEIRLLQG